MSKSLSMQEWALSEKIMVRLGKDEKKEVLVAPPSEYLLNLEPF